MRVIIDRSRPPFRELFPDPAQLAGDKELARHYYRIEYIRETENASLFFTSEHIVMKKLLEYKDVRYDLSTPANRQRCQCEGLRWNRRFTSDVYLGLARLCSVDRQGKIVGLGDIIENPEPEELDRDGEYVILMRELPKSRRLDMLLKGANQFAAEYYWPDMHILTQYIAHLHTSLADIAALKREDGVWGSPEQLKKKLHHNLAFVNQSLLTKRDDQHLMYYNALKKTYILLKDDLLQLFEEGSKYLQYFRQRLAGGFIRRCHGDLKGRNIWIYPYTGKSLEDAQKCVKVLDAVDFNPMYSNIDILSDFAMLVVDVQARAQSPLLADRMIEDYLNLTGQENKVSRAVLAYYLVEKAFIGGIVNIIYDNNPTLGVAFLQVAEMRMRELKRYIRMSL
jgi:aminoglycoside phosphotransferase family enzyme